MTLPGKGSRIIDVEGQAYRWIVSPDSGYNVIIVESTHGKGQRVEVVFDYSDEPLTSSTTRRIIFTALNLGWQPHHRGLKPLRLQESDLS